jgi:DNA polymerase elongation subunit (family B)
MSKILVWDLETTDLKANKGHLLTAAAKWFGDKSIMSWCIADDKDYGKTPLSYMDDKWMVKEIVDVIRSADMLVHQYGDGFDLPFLNTRALFWGLDPAPQIRTVDTWKVMRSTLALTRNSLKNGAAFLNGPDKQKEDNLDISEWMLAAHGDRKILASMLEYNIHDVLATEELYRRLRPLIKNHPNLAEPVEGKDPRLQCPACGSRGKSEGSYYTKMYSVKRRRCVECGTPWEESRSKK